MDNNPEFNEAYWKHQPVEVRAFRALQNDAARSELGLQLMKAGYIIDLEIHIWGWDPWKTMFMRQKLGFTWVPANNQPGLNLVPNEPFPDSDPRHAGVVYDPKRPPAGSVKVSADFADYPPLEIPKPVVPTPIAATHVGVALGNGLYQSLGDDLTPDGQEVTNTSGTFLMHRYISWGGNETRFYTRKAA